MVQGPEFVNLDNARHPDQRRVMQDISSEGFCPFCPENLERHHHEEILRTGDNWTITPNQWPYDNTRTHLLAIATRHIETLGELPSGSFDELQSHLVWAERTYEAKFGGVALRFGDVTMSGASVKHLHAHFILPEDNLPRDKKVRFKIG